MKKFCVSFVLGILCLFTMLNGSSAEILERRNVVGGYSRVDAQDEGVVNAANFALTIALKQTSFTEKLGLLELNPNDYELQVLNASQQVVAGINYKLTVAVFHDTVQSENCVGGFEVVVYNHFGDLRVTGEQVKILTSDEVRLKIEE